ncbi:hypothetical protein A3D77_02050 [Candidatus Gottesmanbacteria bacterium RIFCSPHIGHO2_02_FULL_39_11]|uniref:Uncharacterized protein n=1 Tax=Candidatus Gottesmanbacteria bacterium RIFCSPHIGHO2_02_FULL_39_11 TaxID=1798382 RepID=A0A1F5ZUS4_9BACT|nr:MAG: hypothetical protein A3D77_02050 [Candidatus Gottesmanbacteria bacterium RIFCSPHIGHO2_02_FULL_39_11]
MNEEILIQRLIGAHLQEPQQIGVNTLAPLGPRSDGQDVFTEGSRFSGVEKRGTAESCITIVPAPHIQPSVPRSVFLSEATRAFGHSVELPKSVTHIELFSPQVIVWFRDGDAPHQPFDFESLFQIPQNQRGDYYNAISASTHKALDFISVVHHGSPTLWGTWGFGTPDERIETGQTRGGPTMKQGHLHVSAYDISKQHLTVEALPVKTRLEYTAPWITIIQEEMGDEISQFLIKEIHSLGYPGEINLLNQSSRFANGLVGREKGFHIDFGTPISLPQLYDVLTHLTGSTDRVYQNMNNLWLDYYRHYESSQNTNTNEYESALITYLHALGIEQKKAGSIARFILMIQPTYGQLELLKPTAEGNSKKWIEKRLEKYRLFREKMEYGKIPHRVLTELIYDAAKDPSEINTITLTFPVHASFCFMTDKISQRNGQCEIGDLKLFPDFTTSDGAPQRKLGSVLKRPLGVSK